VKRVLIAAVAMIICVGVLVGLVSGAFAALVESGLYASGLWSRNGASTLAPSRSPTTSAATASPTPSASPSAPVPTPSPVLMAAPSGPPPNPTRLTGRIAGVRVPNATGTYSAAVVDVGTGATLFRHRVDQAQIPASTLKLLTGGAVLSRLGPHHTFRTTVVSPRAGEIVLVGGGDPYLANKATPGQFLRRASVNDLAKRTAAALAKRRITAVRLGYDASYFSGPAWNPAWPPAYGDQVTPVSALWVDEGRVTGRSSGARAKDASRDAAETFAAALRRNGVRVSGLRATRAPQSAAEVAAVSSASLERIVEQMLMVSDNDAAEVLFRHVAIAGGRPGSADEAAKAMRAELTRLGVWTEGTRILDGSGLARRNKVPAATLVRLLRLAADDEGSKLRAVVTGLPVAGVEGTLRRRFGDDASLVGRGVVRGKTGTLRQVQTLAGMVRTRDGSVLVFAFLINNPKNAYNARVWLDRVTAAISSCGCR
jgi:D-alanyl-D-alanine carboxypeptidase/D-alanyl-D-alanine-endopeptidase (penicillin-binding protein 4)